MRNNFKKILLIIFFKILFLLPVLSDDFIFKVSEIEVSDNGNKYKGINGGTITSKDNLKIISDTFEYDKITNIIEAYGNVLIIDKFKNITIETNRVFYLKNEEIIFTKGKSKAVDGSGLVITADDEFRYNRLKNILSSSKNVEVIDSQKDILVKADKIFYYMNEEKIITLGKTEAFIEKITSPENIFPKHKYKINSSDMILYRDKMILSSLEKTSIVDEINTIYNLDEFEYLIDEELLKGKTIQIIDNNVEFGNDQYFYDKGFFDLKEKKFSGKDVNIIFNKMMYDNEENDPRLLANSGKSDEFNTYLTKAVFTSCKKTDKCPPWLITAENVRHDKINKRIIYKDAWLKIYDVPVVYFPKFFHPDPSVIRQSGFLKPNLGNDDVLGRSIYTPYFYALSHDKDITFKPTFFQDGKFVLQNEYREITQNSNTIADFSYTNGHDSDILDKGDSRSHFFSKTNVNLKGSYKFAFEDFLKSTLEIQVQKASNDTYLKLFKLFSPLLPLNPKNLETSITMDLEHDNYDFTTSIEQYESLSGSNNDRYSYNFPKYSFSKNIDLIDYIGSFSLTSSGNNSLSGTNVMSTSFNNNLGYSTNDLISGSGIKNVFGFQISNTNDIGKNSTTLKSSPQAEISTNYTFDSSIPLIKVRNETISTLIPKFSLRFSPHEMKNYRTKTKRIDINNIWNGGRTGAGIEEGGSLTLGVDYTVDFINNKLEDDLDDLDDLDDFFEGRKFEFKIASVLRDKVELNIPKMSTLGEKTSNIVGEINYRHSANFSFEYNYSIDNDMSTFEYNSLDTKFKISKFDTTFSFIEENGILGDSNVLENTSKYHFNSQNTLEFSTRRNRKINLTEYYDLTYRYKNDCLLAGIEYKKKYYSDRDIKPTEELYFSVTIIPLTKYRPDNILRLFE